jgi:hypothetical protein
VAHQEEVVLVILDEEDGRKASKHFGFMSKSSLTIRGSEQQGASSRFRAGSLVVIAQLPKVLNGRLCRRPCPCRSRLSRCRS